MSGQVIERAKLGELTKVGQGGQGVVYRAPNVKTKFAASMVYKEYKPPIVAQMDFTALTAMIALVEDRLSYAEAEHLVSLAAWPCALVDSDGAPTGFIMPAIPDQFFIELTTAKGASATAAEFQHLLNHSSVLQARGITITDAQRYSLLRETASALAFLHSKGVCVGDISPKNLLFGLAPHEAVYFIDCDAMAVNGVSALPQVQTPGWDAPPGEPLATIYTDTYKLGLLALRLLASDQNTTNPGHLPPSTPPQLRQIITDTLTNPPDRRPLPQAWTYILGNAIETAQSISARTDPAVETVALTAPEVPVVRSRPTPQSGPSPSGPVPTAPRAAGRTPPGTPAVQSRTAPRKSVGGKIALLFAGVAIGAIAVVLAVATKTSHHTTFSMTTSPSEPTSSSSSPTYVPAAPAYTPEPAPPPVYTPPPPPPPPPSPPPPPPQMWVAIAISVKNDRWGSARNYTTREEAEATALSKCQEGGYNCKDFVANSDGCVAVAETSTWWTGGWGPTQSEAENDALRGAAEHGSGGHIVVSQCTS